MNREPKTLVERESKEGSRSLHCAAMPGESGLVPSGHNSFAEKDRSREEKWLAEHSREYANQWVALEGDQLIAHSFDAAGVFAAVKALGVERPLFVRVEDPDEPPFAGF